MTDQEAAASGRVPLIIIVAADKGGVGKTTVARLLMDYFSRAGVTARAFDTEPDPGVFRRFFPQAESLDPQTIPGQMRLVDAATSEAITLVDARAGLMAQIIKSFSRINLLADVRDGSLRMLIIHVVDQTVASGGEAQSVDSGFLGAKVIRVNNKRHPDAAFRTQADLELPNLDEESAATIDQESVGFIRFVGDKRNSRTLRGYVNAWLNDCFAEFDRVGIGAMLRT